MTSAIDTIRKCVDIKVRRKRIGLSQTELAKLSGVERSTIVRVEAGESHRWRTFIRIHDALKVLEKAFDNGATQKQQGDQAA